MKKLFYTLSILVILLLLNNSPVKAACTTTAICDAPAGQTAITCNGGQPCIIGEWTAGGGCACTDIKCCNVCLYYEPDPGGGQVCGAWVNRCDAPETCGCNQYAECGDGGTCIEHRLPSCYTPPADPNAVCGNGICQTGEDYVNCPADCPAPGQPGGGPGGSCGEGNKCYTDWSGKCCDNPATEPGGWCEHSWTEGYFNTCVGGGGGGGGGGCDVCVEQYGGCTGNCDNNGWRCGAAPAWVHSAPNVTGITFNPAIPIQAKNQVNQNADGTMNFTISATHPEGVPSQYIRGYWSIIPEGGSCDSPGATCTEIKPNGDSIQVRLDPYLRYFIRVQLFNGRCVGTYSTRVCDDKIYVNYGGFSGCMYESDCTGSCAAWGDKSCCFNPGNKGTTSVTRSGYWGNVYTTNTNITALIGAVVLPDYNLDATSSVGGKCTSPSYPSINQATAFNSVVQVADRPAWNAAVKPWSGFTFTNGYSGLPTTIPWPGNRNSIGYNFSSVPFDYTGTGTAVLNLTGEEWQCTCPTDCTYGNTTAPNIFKWNGNTVTGGTTYASRTSDMVFFLSKFIRGWWQVEGGDIHANGGLLSYIPSGAVSPYLLTRLSGAAESSGVANHASGNVQIDKATRAREDNTQFAPVSEYKGRRENYDYFKRLVELPITPQSDWQSNSLSQPGAASANNIQDVFYYGGNAQITSAWNVATGEAYIVFVNGNLDIRSTVNVDPGGFVAFIVSGNINIDPTVGNVNPALNTGVVEGAYIANGSINTGTTGANNDLRFVGEGIFVGWTRVNPQRVMVSSANQRYAGDYFIYRPDIVINTPDILKSPIYLWQEVAP